MLVRQRPGSAKGVVFLTLEDEFAVCNAVIWPQVLETHRAVVMGARLMLIKGRVQRTGDIIHVVAASIEDQTPWLSLLTEDGTTMKNSLARADEVASPGPTLISSLPRGIPGMCGSFRSPGFSLMGSVLTKIPRTSPG